MARQHSDYLPPPSVGHEIGVMFGFIGMYIQLLSWLCSLLRPLSYTRLGSYAFDVQFKALYER